MRCGAKRFHAEIEIEGEKKMLSLVARTPAEARKYIRRKYGELTQIISVRERKETHHSLYISENYLDTRGEGSVIWND